MRRRHTNLEPKPALHPLIEKMINLQNLAEFEAPQYAGLADRIELMILVLSAIASGRLWHWPQTHFQNNLDGKVMGYRDIQYE
jgi:hypothetical protein